MKLKDEIMELVDVKFNRMMETFQDSDRIQIDPALLQRLIAALPLLQDVKTEVSSIEKKLDSLKPKSSDQDNPEDGDHYDPLDDSTPDSTNPEVQKLLRDLDDAGKEVKELRRRLRRFKQLEPRDKGLLEQIIQNLPTIMAIHYLYKNSVEEFIRKATGNDIDSAFGKQTREIIHHIDSKTGEIISDLTDCCDDVHLILGNIQSQLEECCHSIHSILADQSHDLSVIEHKLDVLDPEGFVVQNLGVDSKIKAILSELQSLRGLL